MRRLRLSAALFLTAASACGRGPEPAAPAPRGPAPASSAAASPAASSTAEAPPPADPVSAAEMRKEIAAYTLTEPAFQAIVAAEKELGDFWADPVEARKIRSERNLKKILAAIEASPRLKETLAKHRLTGRDYILGSFSMIAGFVWEKSRQKDPAAAAKQQPPVNAATLAVVSKHLDDVQRMLSPAPKPTKKAAGRPDEG